MSRYYGDFENSYGGSGRACGGSRNPHNSSPPIDQYDGDSSRGYNHYNEDHQNEGKYADNRRLIENNGRGGHSHQNKYSTRYDDLIDSRRDTNRYSDSLGSRQDPYSRMDGYNDDDDYDGEYRNYRSTQYRDSRHNDDATDHHHGNQPSKSTDDDEPNNRYGARHKSPGDNFAHGDRYRNGGKSFDEVNAGYGYALRNDDAARRYMPENDDRYVHDGEAAGRHHHHHQRDRHYYY